MEALQDWGLDLITTVQRVQGPVPEGIFHAITFMAHTEFYFFLLPFLFWCVDSRLGARLSVFYLLSSYVNVELKTLFEQPRPFEIDPSVNLSVSEGYAFPSGHAQSATVVWGGLGAYVGNRRFRVAAIAAILFVGVSRVYLGVHFPTDVLAGWAVGAVLLVLYLTLHRRIERWLIGLDFFRQLLLAVGIPLVLFLIYPFGESKDGVGALAGLMSGIGVGLVLVYRYVPFTTIGPWRQRTLRYVVGISIFLVMFLGLEEVFPSEGSSYYAAFLSLRHALAGVGA